MTKQVKIGLVQMNMEQNVVKNRDKALHYIKEAAARGADIVCLPELFTTLYFCNQEKTPVDYRESIPGPTMDLLAKAAKENNIVLVGGSIFEKSDEGNFNTSAVFERDGSMLGLYRKMHIPHDPGFFEQHYFAKGNLGYRVFNTSVGRLSVLICFDQWFPEAARACALEGAEIIFYPTAIGNLRGLQPDEGNWQESWENVQRGHAIANAVHVVGVNRVGEEGDSAFWGGSFVCDAFGKTIWRAGCAEGVSICPVNLELNKIVEEGWGFRRNRRAESYGRLLQM